MKRVESDVSGKTDKIIKFVRANASHLQKIKLILTPYTQHFPDDSHI